MSSTAYLPSDVAEIADVIADESARHRGMWRVAPRGVSPQALASRMVAKSGRCVCFGLSGTNTKASAQYIQIFDALTVPADGAIPATVFYVPATQNFSLDYGPRGRRFQQGVIVCNSSTAATKTEGLADCWFDVLVIDVDLAG